MRNSSLITKSLIAVSILASCEKDPIDEIQDDYLYEMMTQEEILVEETSLAKTSTQSSTIELTSTQSSTIELSETQSSTIEITQVESTTVELTQTDSTTVEITNVATTTTVIENNNDDSNDDSNESNDSQVDNSNDNTEAPASNDSDNTPVDNTPVVQTQVASPVAVVDNTPQPIVVNSNDLDWETFDVNAQDIVIHDGVEYTSVEFEALVDAHVAQIAAQVQANEAQQQAHANVEAPVAQANNNVETPQVTTYNVRFAFGTSNTNVNFFGVYMINENLAEGQVARLRLELSAKDGYKIASMNTTHGGEFLTDLYTNDGSTYIIEAAITVGTSDIDEVIQLDIVTE